MPTRHRKTASVLLIATSLCAVVSAPAQARAFVLEEATVESIHSAFRDGSLTCAALVKSYLGRIEAYDRQGPALRAILTINPQVLQQAAALDQQYKASRGKVGPLFCIPVILKDNFNTFDLPTSGGNVAMKASQPAADAFTVGRMRKAGALILAKSNLQEFARGGVSLSSLGGQVLNPYDLTRTPNSSTQDEIGPITRTVKDAARLLDVMVGYDPQDPVTAFGLGKPPASYAAGVKATVLTGARIGVMGNLYGKEERHGEVNRVMEQVIAAMEARGATLVRFTLPEYDTLSQAVSTDRYEARTVFDKYFAELGPGAPVTSFRQLVDSKTASPDIQKTMEAEIAIEDGLNNATYRERTLNREKLRIAVASRMAELKLDAIQYPQQRILVALAGQPDQPERNGTLSHGTGFPAVTFPGGFSAPTATAPLGVPVGAELLGRDYSEPLLLSLAYSFEQAAKVRKPPVSTPALR